MPVERKAKYELLFDLPGMAAGSIVTGGFKRTFHDGLGVVIGSYTFTEEFIRRHPTWFRRVYVCGLCDKIETIPVELTVVGAGQKVVIYRCERHLMDPFKYSEDVHEPRVNPAVDDVSSEDEEDELCEICKKLRKDGDDDQIKCEHK